jgi:FkbM family methyltransferase
MSTLHSTYLNLDRQALVEELDRSYVYSQNVFKNDITSKLRMLLRHPIKTVERKIILGLFKQKRNFTLRTRSFWGERMYVNNFEPHQWFCGLIAADAEVRLSKFFIQNLRSGDTFLDVGAHHGFYTLLAHRLLHGRGDIHAFEPVAAHFRILAKNAQGKANVHIEQAAVSVADGQVMFHESISTSSTMYKDFFDRSGKTFHEVQVRTVGLDSYCAAHKIKPTYIKIDVEGAEADVLSGARRILSSYQPTVAMEIWKDKLNNMNHLAAIRLLLDLGYKAFRIGSDGELIAVADLLSDIVHATDSEVDNYVFRR